MAVSAPFCRPIPQPVPSIAWHYFRQDARIGNGWVKRSRQATPLGDRYAREFETLQEA